MEYAYPITICGTYAQLEDGNRLIYVRCKAIPPRSARSLWNAMLLARDATVTTALSRPSAILLPLLVCCTYRRRWRTY